MKSKIKILIGTMLKMNHSIRSYLLEVIRDLIADDVAEDDAELV